MEENGSEWEIVMEVGGRQWERMGCSNVKRDRVRRRGLQGKGKERRGQ